MFKLYDKLLQHPLFQGLGYTDLKQIIAHTKFDFIKFNSGETIVCAGKECNHLYMLTDGTIEISTSSLQNDLTVKEWTNTPTTFQLERLFGLHQQFSSTYTAITPCSFITIDKRELMWLAEAFMVFRMNLMNLLTTQIQKNNEQKWNQNPTTLEEHIILFFINHCILPTGKKQFFILMNQLAQKLNDSRLDISCALNNLQNLDYITLHRGRIDIPDIEKLNLYKV